MSMPMVVSGAAASVRPVRRSTGASSRVSQRVKPRRCSASSTMTSTQMMSQISSSERAVETSHGPTSSGPVRAWPPLDSQASDTGSCSQPPRRHAQATAAP